MKIIITNFFLLTTFFVFSNNECFVLPPDSTSTLKQKTAAAFSIEKGRVKFEEGKIRGALLLFREAQQKDPNSWKASYWIAQCHYKLNNFGYALSYVIKARERGGNNLPKESFLLQGKAYHRVGNLDSAQLYYEKSKELLSKLKSKELRVDDFLKEVDLAKKMMENKDEPQRTRLFGEINSGYDDYGMVTLGDSVAYITARRNNTTGGGLNPSDEKYFEDIYKLKWDAESEMWGEVTNELGKLNSDGFESINHIAPDGLIAYITLNNTEVPKVKKPTRSSDICEAKRNKNGKWNSPKIIKNKSINTSFFEGAVTLTADGNTMYFVSDRRGEKSLTDIYVVHKQGNTWGTAKPLPDIINTKEGETTPFITPDGRFLFFSSEGHKGMGGYDVYVSEKQGETWSEPINLGGGINSVNNDTHFSYNSTTKKGYVSSYHIIGKKSSIDIFEIDFSKGMPFIK